MPAVPSDRIALMQAFADMYRGKRFDREGSDEDGYLQTTLSNDDRMPLEFFVEYNNAWWFEIISGANPLVRLDRYGNAVWLETGCDLTASLRAALVFLDTPKGRAFAAEDPTAQPITRIRANLAELEARLPG